MCGIAGILKINGATTPEDNAVVQRMIDAQAHRGPDAEGIMALGVRGEGLGTMDNLASLLTPHSSRSSITLGHRRLSIIDLSEAGSQPMSDAEGSIWISYNGEIYNFRDLRDALMKSGHRFRSQSDTEVLIYGYKEWGKEGLLRRLRGMFAFAIWDQREQTLFAARDRFGIKPFYYSVDPDRIAFASELKGLLRSGIIPQEIDPAALYLYLAWGSIPAPKTFYRDIAALPPGHWLTFNEEGLRTGRYWDLAEAYSGRREGSISDEEAGEVVHAALLDSVKAHLVSDVPVGVFLSGGTDSTALLSLMHEAGQSKIRTFTIFFPNDPDYNEGPVARRVARQFETDHVEVEVTPEMFSLEWDRIFEAIDQPTVDGVNTYFVSKIAREAGAKVVLSGLGGDELFGGYPSFHSVPQLWNARRLSGGVLGLAPLWTRLLPGKNLGKREKLRYLFRQPPDFRQAYFAYRGLFMPPQIEAFLSPEMIKSLPKPQDPTAFLPDLKPITDPWDKVAVLESGAYMAHQLLRDTDAVSMAHSVEVRVPFVDHLLLESVARLSPRLKDSPRLTKPLLARLIPEPVREGVLRGGKRGFTFPFERWLKGPLRKAMEERLFVPAGGSSALASEKVAGLWQEYLDGKRHWSRVWAMIISDHYLSRDDTRIQQTFPKAFESPRSMESILVYRTGQLGDTVCAIPALKALRENFGPCKLVLLSDIHPGTAHPKAHEVLLEFGLIDDSLVYDPHNIFSPAMALSLRRQILQRHIRRAIYLAPRHRGPLQRLRDLLFFKSCGIKHLHGLQLFKNENRGFAGQHEAQRLLDVLRRESLTVPEEPSFNLTLPEEARQKIDQHWTGMGLDRKKVIAIGPGSKMPVKRWGVENYREVGTRLIERYSVHLLLLGGKDEEETAEELHNAWGNHCTNLTGKTSYAESGEILRRSAFYLGNDSGAMHLAAAVGTRCVAIFSARDAVGSWYPYGKQHIVLRKEVECQGCLLTECVEQKMKCIKNISVEEVLAACERFLVQLERDTTTSFTTALQ
jgi:asparagine synthase (glutamine-hydrolysing)